jgi:hypothetical protein
LLAAVVLGATAGRQASRLIQQARSQDPARG